MRKQYINLSGLLLFFIMHCWVRLTQARRNHLSTLPQIRGERGVWTLKRLVSLLTARCPFAWLTTSLAGRSSWQALWALLTDQQTRCNKCLHVLILLASSVFVTACVSSGGGGGGGAPATSGRVGVFSHAAYDFVLANATRLNAALASRVLGVVYLEEAEVRARLGSTSRITGVTYTLTGLEREFFSIAPRQAVDLTSGVRVSFGSPNFPHTPMMLNYVVNTLGVDRMTVTAAIAYVDARGAERTLRESVPVSVRAVADVPAVDAFLAFDGIVSERRVVNTTDVNQPPIMQRQLRFTAEGTLAEDAGARAGVDGLNAALTRLGIRSKLPAGFARMPTIYFRVANASGAALADCGRLFYLDNQDRSIRTRAGGQLDYEAQAAYGCKLEASLRGEHYTEVVARPSAAALRGIDNVTGGVASGSGNATACAAGDLAVVRAGGCTYRAEFAIGVRDVNEPVVLDVTLRNRSVYENDVRGLTQRPAVGVVPQQDVLLATVRYREQDHDEANQRLHVAAPVLAAMTPRAAPDVFVVQPHSGDEVGLYLNVSAAQRLDYETLPVNATGQKAYRLLLRATDNSTARLVTDATVHVEVKDVIYAPTNFTYRNASGGAVLGQMLLPGLAQFVSNGGPVLGTLMALDPETQRADVVDYTYIGVSGIAQDRWHRNATINGSFALTGDKANQLTLIGLGLRDGDAFTINLAAAHRDAKRPLPADAYASLPLSIRVNYRSDLTGYGAQPPLRFTAGVLNGTVPEGIASAPVLLDGDDLRAHVDPQSVTGARFFDLLNERDINNLLASAPGLQGLNRADAAVFVLNATTGELALQADQMAHFTTKPFYTLLVRVSNTTAMTAADYARSDYALLEVAVADTNLAPRLVALHATDARLAQADQTAGLTLELPEDTAAGTEIARLEVMDDNPLRGLTWGIRPAGPAAAMFAVTPVTVASRPDARTRNYTAVYALRTTAALNYEALPDQGRVALTLHLTDGGQYGVDLQQRQVHALGRDHAMLMVGVAGNVTDVNEPIALRVASTASVAENATEGTQVVAVEVVDPDEDIGAETKLIPDLRSVPASLAPALALTNFNSVSDNRSRWDLVVANASLLENAGDGRTFELEIVVAENRTANPTRASARLALTVTDVVHPFVPPVLGDLMLNLSEQQALNTPSGLVLREELFSFSADVQRDYDEFWFGRLRVVDAQARAGAMGYTDAITRARALVGEERFNLLDLRTRGDAVDLLLGEARLIEDKLIGDRIELMLNLVDPSGAVAPAALPVEVAILQPAASDRVRFADADDGFGMEVPSAYTFEYTQSDYAPALSGSVCDGADPAVNITIDGSCYATVRLEDGQDYVRRDRAGQGYFGAADEALRNGTGAEIGLVFTDAEVNVSALGIYALDREGSLRVADAEFEQFFELEAVARYLADGAVRPALVVRPRELAVLNRTTNQPLAAQSYLALDTLALSPVAPPRNLQFFVVAVEDGGDVTNATQRAIAQLNFMISAVGNVPAEVRELRLADTYDLLMDGGARIAENGLPGLVNNVSNALNITVVNPDGPETNQSVDVVVEVVATEARSDGNLNPTTGEATGHALIRLGAAATSNVSFTLADGANVSMQRMPFQLARNAHGRALVRVTLIEKDRAGQPLRDGRQVLHYALVVTSREPPTVVVTNVTVDGLRSGQAMEDGFGPSPQLRFGLNSTAFVSPWDQRLTAVMVTARTQQPFPILTTRGPASITDGGPIQTVTQAVNYAQHAHGMTDLIILATIVEPRGFEAQEVGVARRLTDDFAIESVNDALRLLPELAAVPASLRLSAFNFDSNPPNATAVASTEAAVFLADVDLTTGDALPRAIRILPGTSQIINNTRMQLNASNLAVGALVAQPVANNRTRIRVPVPAIRITLTRAQFDTINRRDDGITLNFTVNVVDSGNASLHVNATARVDILLTTYDAVVAAGAYADGAARLNENSAIGTAVFDTPLNVTDNDLLRPTGDTYTYGLQVTRADQPITDLLRWNVPGQGPAQSVEEVVSGPRANQFQRDLVLARSPDDVDVGTYQVRWTVSETRGETVFNRRVATGGFNLTIVNQEEAPTVACDARNGTAANCGYLEGETVLQNIFGTHDATRLGELRATGARVQVVFVDPDLLALGDAALPVPANLSLTNAVLTNHTDGALPSQSDEHPLPAERINITAGVMITRLATTDRFAITMPLALHLTRADYDFINQRAGASLNFQLNLAHALGTTSARARLRIRANANNPIINVSNGFTTALFWPEGTAADTALVTEPLHFNITDPDVTRQGGDSYTYGLTVTGDNGPVTGLLAWNVGMHETVQQEAQHFNRTIVFAKDLDDADVGRYTVTWNITDAFNTRVAGAAAAEGRFTLNITNVNDPIAPAALPPRTASYQLRDDFNPGGVRRRTPVLRNATVFFTDRDLIALGAAALPRANMTTIGLNQTQIAPLANLSFGDLSIRQEGTSQNITVVVPVLLNLTDAQFNALGMRGGVSFRLNITVIDAGDPATLAWMVTQIIIAINEDARVEVEANTYAGGSIPDLSLDHDHTNWERIFGNTAVFVKDDPDPDPPITIIDRDITTTRGDTYTYGLSVRNASNAAIEGMLRWSHGTNETLKEQTTNAFNRTIRFARDLTEADIGTYTVVWNITEARPSLRPAGAAAGNGTFTMTITQTPNIVQLSFFPRAPTSAENEDPSSLGASGTFTYFGQVAFTLEYNRSVLGNFFTVGFPVLFAREEFRRLPRNHNQRSAVSIETLFAPTDQQVGEHAVVVLATGAGGTVRTNLIFRIRNVNDDTRAAAGPLMGKSSGVRFDLPLFNLTDGDFQIPARAAAIRARGGITVTSWLNLTFTRYAQGSAQTQSCALPRRERFIAGTLAREQFEGRTRLAVDLLTTPACAAIYRAAEEEGADNLTLTRAQLFDYTEPSGGPERAEGGLVIAVGQLNVTIGDDDGDGIPNDVDPDDDNNGLYEIRTAEDLDAIRANLNASYELVRSINLTTYPNWQPLGNLSSPFTGRLDGRGHTIGPLNINLSANNTRYVGLFGVADDAAIDNLTLRIGNMQARRHTVVPSPVMRMGGLIALARFGSSIRNVGAIIEGNLSVNLSSDAGGPEIYLGGLVGGIFNDVTVKNSYVLVLNGGLSGTAGPPNDAITVGGLIGRMGAGARAAATVEDSYVIVTNRSILHAASASVSTTGGLLGWQDGAVLRRVYAVNNGRLIGNFVGGMIGVVNEVPGHQILVSYVAAPGLNAIGWDRENTNADPEDFQLDSRTLSQLECPTVANATCAGADPTYAGWNSTIWDFGDNQTLPDLRSNRRPADVQGRLF